MSPLKDNLRPADVATFLGLAAGIAMIIGGAVTNDTVQAAKIALFLFGVVTLLFIFLRRDLPFFWWRRAQWSAKRMIANSVKHRATSIFRDLLENPRLPFREGPPDGEGRLGYFGLAYLNFKGLPDEDSLLRWWQATGLNKKCFISLSIPSSITMKHIAVLGALRRLQAAYVEPVIYLNCSVEHRQRLEAAPSLEMMERDFMRLISLFLREGAYDVYGFAQLPSAEDALTAKPNTYASGDPTSADRLSTMLCTSSLGDLKEALRDQRVVDDSTSLMRILVPINEILSVFLVNDAKDMVLCGPDLKRFWLWAFERLRLNNEKLSVCCLPLLSDNLIGTMSTANRRDKMEALLRSSMSEKDLLNLVLFLYELTPAWATKGMSYIGDRHVMECVRFLSTADTPALRADAEHILTRNALRDHVIRTAPVVFTQLTEKARK